MTARCGVAAAVLGVIAACPVGASAASAASAADTGAWTVEVALRAHGLRERSTVSGTVLVRESAVAPTAGVRWAPTQGTADWTASVRLDAWLADASYDGRSQAGQPVTSRTGTGAGRLEAAVQRHFGDDDGPARWIEFGVHAEHFVRRIRAAGLFAGLDERTTQPRAQVGLGFGFEDGTVRAVVFGGRAAALRVRFDGALFDDATLRSGRGVGGVVTIERSWGPGRSIVLGAERLEVGASEVASLARAGVPVGTVQQPAWTRDAVWLGLRLAWR